MRLSLLTLFILCINPITAKAAHKTLGHYGLPIHTTILFFTFEDQKLPKEKGCCARLQNILFPRPSLKGEAALVCDANDYDDLRRKAPEVFHIGYSPDGKPQFRYIPRAHQRWSTRKGKIPLDNEEKTLEAVAELSHDWLDYNRLKRPPTIYVNTK